MIRKAYLVLLHDEKNIFSKKVYFEKSHAYESFNDRICSYGLKFTDGMLINLLEIEICDLDLELAKHQDTKGFIIEREMKIMVKENMREMYSDLKCKTWLNRKTNFPILQKGFVIDKDSEPKLQAQKCLNVNPLVYRKEQELQRELKEIKDDELAHAQLVEELLRGPETTEGDNQEDGNYFAFLGSR